MGSSEAADARWFGRAEFPVTADRLRVLLHGQAVGTLEQANKRGAPSFTYDESYVAASGLALSASLPLQRATYQPERVMPYLRGLLPENRYTLMAWGDRHGTDYDDVFAMLANMGWDCPGAVQFCRDDELEAIRARDREYVPVDEQYIADRLRGLVDDSAGWSMPEEHWSLGGQQEKFALAFITGRWHEARGSAATTHIFKPGIAHLASQALVEHATMTAAASLGVDAAETRFMHFGDQQAIVVKRFDRIVNADSVQRIHQEDFCQALRRLPENKYEHRGGPTLNDMAGLIQRQSHDRQADALALADFLIINVVAGAPDGHAKNISMLRGASNWVAPLYDLATGLVYDKSTVDRTVAVSVGGEREVGRIRSRQWAKAAKTLKIDPVDLNSRVRQLATDFPSAFARALADCGDSPEVEQLSRRSGTTIQQHCDRILDQLL